MEKVDLLICTGEPSGDLHGASLLKSLFQHRPDLRVAAVSGPKMRAFPIHQIFPMESLKTMGFFDLLPSLPRLIRLFFRLQREILRLDPKVVIFIDYPGFHLRMQKSLRKKGFQNKLIHFICPTVWAWGKKRIPSMAKTLDLLLCILPFEPTCFSNTSLPVKYVGHPLTTVIQNHPDPPPFPGKILSIFPGSRKKEIERNLPLQLKVAKRLQAIDPDLQVIVCSEEPVPGFTHVPFKENYKLMRSSLFSLATSGTVSLELALHQIPSIVCYAITKKDLFLAQKIFKIDLPFYSLPNILLQAEVFPELFGPHLTEESLFFHAQNFLLSEDLRKKCSLLCEQVKKTLGNERASERAVQEIFSSVDF